MIAHEFDEPFGGIQSVCDDSGGVPGTPIRQHRRGDRERGFPVPGMRVFAPSASLESLQAVLSNWVPSMWT